MKVKIITIIAFIHSLTSLAVDKLPPLSIFSWTVSPDLGEVINTQVDTIALDFQHFNTGDGYRSPRGYLGNLGSPSYSKIFFLEKEPSRFIFANAFEPYFHSAKRGKYYNTTIPLTNISYFSGGSSLTSEERFKVFFTANAGKKTNVGVEMDNIYARGFYTAQAVDGLTYRFFGSYTSDHYNLNSSLGNSNLSNQENGGIVDDNYIKAPNTISNGKTSNTPRDIPIKLDQAWNRVNGGMFFLTHRYNIGFYKTEKKDTATTKTFIPVSSFIHTLEYNKIERLYIEKSEPTNSFYQNNFYTALAFDNTKYKSFRNTIAISLQEGFNKFAVFGLSSYLKNEVRNFNFGDSITHTEQSTFIGGELSRKKGKSINYQANAEIGVLGEDIGQFKLTGNLNTKIKLFKREVQFNANGYIKNINPSFYLNKYISRHFMWDNNFKFERRVRLEGEIAIPKEHFSIKAGVENMQNHLYFNNDALPTQEINNIQILSGLLSKDFKFGILHLDNEIYGQYSSNQKIVPLPSLSLYHNLYIITKLAKVLTFQIGSDIRYHSEYYALNYQPATIQFFTQDKVKIGNSPLICAYANLHLKRTRFYIMYYHVNQGTVAQNYFSTPHYPLNPRFIKIGVSWNFNN